MGKEPLTDMGKLSERKNNRLSEYDYSRAGAYFITICVREKRCVFGKIVGGDAHIAPFIELTAYGRVVRKVIESINRSYHNVHMDKYVIMPNHIHMILLLSDGEPNAGTMWASSPTSALLPQVIRTVKILVTKEIGVSVWQRSYHDHIIRNEEDYLRIWQYIDVNPIKWADDMYYRT